MVSFIVAVISLTIYYPDVEIFSELYNNAVISLISIGLISSTIWAVICSSIVRPVTLGTSSVN